MALEVFRVPVKLALNGTKSFYATQCNRSVARGTMTTITVVGPRADGKHDTLEVDEVNLASREARERLVIDYMERKVLEPDVANQGLKDLFVLVEAEMRKRPRGLTPLAGSVATESDAWQEDLDISNGRAKETLANICLILEHDVRWAKRLWWDEVRGQPMQETHAIDDDYIKEVTCLLGDKPYRVPCRTHKTVGLAFDVICHRTKRDLLVEWLEGLPPWDEQPRLTEWLEWCAGVPCNAYAHDLSRLLPVSLVARAIQPGCQYRYVIILQGPQDQGKSKLVANLVGDAWYQDMSHELGSKESRMLIRGVWLAELGELDSMRKTELNTMKGFVTQRMDVWIPKFANYKVSHPRRAVFVGTTNEEVFLNDPTGSTRYFPIDIGTMDPDGVVALREQLFAEALIYFQDHPNDWWRLSSEGGAQAGDERERRQETSVYEPALALWLEGDKEAPPYHLPKTVTSWEEIAQGFLGLDSREKWKDKALQMQIGQALRALGWVRKVERHNGILWRGWVRGGS